MPEGFDVLPPFPDDGPGAAPPCVELGGEFPVCPGPLDESVGAIMSYCAPFGFGGEGNEGPEGLGVGPGAGDEGPGVRPGAGDEGPGIAPV